MISRWCWFHAASLRRAIDGSRVFGLTVRALFDLFALSAPSDSHFLLNLARGAVRFGPAIHEPEGGWRRYGAVSPVGATMRLSRYRQGGGGAGNVARRALTIMPVAIPRIATATNPRAATGGVDAESLDGARERAQLIEQAKPAHVNYRLRVRAPSRELGSGA